MAQYILSIDQGTTSSRCIAFDKKGRTYASHQLEHCQITPRPGWVEHDADEILKNISLCITETLKKSGLLAMDIAAVGVTNQRETTLIWNRHTGKPYHNAIVWQDTRTSAICAELSRNGGKDKFRSRTGLPIAPYFSATKIKWLFENVKDLRRDAEKGDALFGNIDTWLIWNLTGAHVTDVTNASRTMLMNIASCEWDPKMLAAFDIPAAMLPDIRPSSDPRFYGLTRKEGPFGGEIPFCGDLGDQQAATVGQVCFTPGEVKNTYGTGCFMLMNTGKLVHSKKGLLTTPCYQFGGDEAVYGLEGSIAVAGSLLQWLRDNLELVQSAPEVDIEAEKVNDCGGVTIVPAFAGLFAPYWRSDARGVIVGLTGYVNKSHLCRAALEATAYQTRDILEAMESDSGVPITTLKVDGGMTASNPLMQIQADIINTSVIRPKIMESTALGAAYVAGLAVGFWTDKEELSLHWEEEKRWNPTANSLLRTKGYALWKDAVKRSLDQA